MVAGGQEFRPQTVGIRTGSFTFQTDSVVDPASIQVRFINDHFDPATGFDRNLRVDNIVLDGVVFEAEDPSVLTAGFFDGTQIATGNFQTEIIHSNGFFQFGATQTGTGSFTSDTSFGVNGQTGIITSGFDVAEFFPTDDGRTIVSDSQFTNGNFINTLTVVDADGNFDGTFANGGIIDLRPVFTSAFGLGVSGENDRVEVANVLIDSQDRLVVTGSFFPDGVGFPTGGSRVNFVTRINPDGTLDPSVVQITETEGFSFTTDNNQILVDEFDRIIIANPNASEFEITRLNSDGTADTSFGSNGVASLGFDANGDQLSEVQLNSDNSIVVLVTPLSFADPVSGTLIRLDSNGQIDNGFGQQGAATISPDDFNVAGPFPGFFNDFEIDGQGRIVVSGSIVELSLIHI